MLVGGAAAIAVLVVVFLWPRSAGKVTAVTVTALPAEWTQVDLSTLPDGASVVVSGTGAFSVRIGNGTPILVDGTDVDIASLSRSGTSVQPEGNEPVQVSFEVATP